MRYLLANGDRQPVLVDGEYHVKLGAPFAVVPRTL